MKKAFQKIGGSDGLASYNDYMKFLLESKVSPKVPNTESKWDTIKRLYNENKDNKVSWSELIKAQPKLNTMEMKAIFNNISKNQGGLASYNDYIKFVKRSEEVKPMARPMMMDRRL